MKMWEALEEVTKRRWNHWSTPRTGPRQLEVYHPLPLSLKCILLCSLIRVISRRQL